MSELQREIGSSLTKLRALLAESKHDLFRIRTLQDSLTSALEGFWDDPSVLNSTQSSLSWKENLSLVASGRIISVSAQAEQVLGATGEIRERSWPSDGKAYVKWLGDGVVKLATSTEASEAAATEDTGKEQSWARISDLFGKSFSLGYTDDLVDCVVSKLLQTKPIRISEFQKLAKHLPVYRQRHLVDSTLRYLESRLAAKSNNGALDGADIANDAVKREISGAAAMLHALVSLPNTTYAECLSGWLTKGDAKSTDLYRASVAALNKEKLQDVLEKVWLQFGDKMFIRHTPIIQQEALTRILLLAAGYVHRSNPMQLFVLARSSTHTNGISNRLASSSGRARFLGMVVGTAISNLSDKPDSRMRFEIEDMETDEAKLYQSLVHIDDKIGSVEDLIMTQVIRPKGGNKSYVPKPKKTAEQLAPNVKPKIVEIVEEDNAAEDSDDLVPYDKPDSDPEDSDEDATLVSREKPRAPVYVRDLISGLQDVENYERHKISLESSSSLIRRKADFGTELKDWCRELGSTLVSLQDNFEIDDFHELKLQSMVALLVAQPQIMGPWFASTFFSGDYSIGQRASVLTTMGLGARELAGFKGEYERSQEKDFPTKTLPQRLHKLYADATEVNAIAQKLEQGMIRPVTMKRRKKMIRNDLAKQVADCFFFPLTGRWQGVGQTSTVQNTHLSHLLLPTYLKTLGIILTSAGSSTVALPQMTSEFWDLLLSVRNLTLKDPATLEAELFSFLSILNINEDKRRLAQEHSKRLLETHEWTNMVFEKTSGGDEEGDRCRTLAAGVLVATKEVLDAHHRLLLGDMADFMND